MITYGYEIRWTRKNGKEIFGVSGCSTPEEAKNECLKIAKEIGWTPPKWYQFRRWNDTRIKEKL